MRAVMFGVDGLTFRILHPLIERGDLPNFRKLRQEGCEAVLESKYPPLTPPAWTSLSTGLKSARHGVYDFWWYDEQQAYTAARTPHVQTHRRGEKAIWNILSEYGKQVLVLNVPVTYPPEAINGIMVSGYLTPGTGIDFTYPANFKEELFRIVPNYKLDLDPESYGAMKVTGEVGPLVDAVLGMTEDRIKLFMHLLKEKPWDFCYLAFIGADRLQHPIWEEIISLDTKATEYFRLLDHALGLIMEQLEPEDVLFVISDHGFQGHSSYFDINEYLYSKGLLSMRPDFQSRQRAARRYNTLNYIITRAGLRPLARKARRKLKSLGVVREAAQDSNEPLSLLKDIDWERTAAYVPSYSGFQGGYADIFLAPDIDAGVIAELCEDLKRQTDPKNGHALIDAIYTTEVFGEGPYKPREKHLLLLPTDGITFRVELGNERLWDNLGKSFGSHQKDGVLYAYGGNFKRGFQLPSAEIYDLVPTLLRSMGLPFPYDFDGRALDELFVNTQAERSVNDTEGSARRKLKKLQEV